MKRKDSKGRVLRTNELQRSDGRYEYRYIDVTGKKKCIYSWRLSETDSAPTGKYSAKSLREMEQEITKDTLDGILYSNKQTLNERWDMYISGKTEIKQSTRNNYIYMYNKHVRDDIGKQKIKHITYTVVKQFFSNLITEKGFKPVSVETFYTMLRPVFEVAVRDGVIRLNPADKIIPELRKSHEWIKTKRHSLSREQTAAFLQFIKDHKTYAHWYPLFICLFGTGCRIGEFLGLTWSDIYWKDNVISVNHNLIYRRQEDGKMKFHVTTPKTKNSVRTIPMLGKVKSSLKAEYKRQSQNEGFCKAEIDGYKGFIWQSELGNPYSISNINEAIARIVCDYNAAEETAAQKGKRQPELLPHFSAHVCRHTFCCRLCEEETDLKLIQEIMGHANISTTMDIYNESNAVRKQRSFERLEQLGSIF